MDHPPILYTLDSSRLAVVVARPSKSIKSPYVADIQFADDPTIYQAHAPSLGCSGLVEVDSNVYVIPSKNPASKTTHSIYGTIVYGGWRVGVNPSIANAMVRRIIEAGLGPEKDFAELQQEVTIEDSRIDIRLTGKDGSHTWIEVKNVPLAHTENLPGGCADYRAACTAASNKIALFPDGYRKKKTDTISPRAAKHLGTLASRVAAGDRAYIIYLCQRMDADQFQPAALDTHYSESLRDAIAAGVVAKCYRVSWSADFSTASFGGEIPVTAA